MRYCDIVMKGGITSGVVYPAAVAEIAKKFVFKNIGGTSAGAIAASLTAAAERRRCLDNSNEGFDRISAIPKYLATDSHLYRLFAPNKGAKSLYRTIIGLFGRSRIQPPLLGKWCGLVWAFPVAAFTGAVPGFVSIVAVYRTHMYTPNLLWACALAIAVLTIVGGMTVAIGVALLRDVAVTLPKNFYGLVTGVDDENPSSEHALCTWLSAELSKTAGLDNEVPLTFGMLWDAKRSPVESFDHAIPDSPDVNLEMITTNVTWGRPFNFPIASRKFFFDPEEMRRFFPSYVVDWMVARARKPDEEEKAKFASYAPRLPLPEMGDLPIIVATRMSLAFPFLLSAVPLWAADYSRSSENGKQFPLEHVWFSDGGISSNFPVTLFDSPLPRWPTFAINLSSLPDGRDIESEEAENVAMIKRSADGTLPVFNRFGKVGEFVSVIANAMQNWNDNTQITLPGYRDRMVTVYLGKDEGGLNLDMPATTLERLRLRGAAAGKLISDRFEKASVLDPTLRELGWETHRWLRFRNSMGLIRSYLQLFQRGMRSPELPDVTYGKLCEADAGIPVHSYPIAAAERQNISDLASELADLGSQLEAKAEIAARLPRPLPHLVVRASLKA